MTCPCGNADECDGDVAIYYPLQDGGSCATGQCCRPVEPTEED